MQCRKGASTKKGVFLWKGFFALLVVFLASQFVLSVGFTAFGEEVPEPVRVVGDFSIYDFGELPPDLQNETDLGTYADGVQSAMDAILGSFTPLPPVVEVFDAALKILQAIGALPVFQLSYVETNVDGDDYVVPLIFFETSCFEFVNNWYESIQLYMYCRRYPWLGNAVYEKDKPAEIYEAIRGSICSLDENHTYVLIPHPVTVTDSPPPQDGNALGWGFKKEMRGFYGFKLKLEGLDQLVVLNNYVGHYYTDDHGNSFEEATPIELDGNNEYEEECTFSGNNPKHVRDGVDVFKLSAAKGAALKFRAYSLGSAYTIVYQVKDSSGAIVAQGRSGLYGTVKYKIPESGTYYIEVSPQQSFINGRYKVRLSVVPTPSTTVTAYRFVKKWGSEGSGNGQFHYLEGVAVDASGNVYVVDYWNHRVQKFDSQGNFLAKWGSEGSGDGQFNYFRGIAVDVSGNVYVADSGNHRVQKFDSQGNFLTKWGDGQFSYLRGIAVDVLGNVYVADSTNNRIQKFDSQGNFLAKWGSYGSGDGQFADPYGIAVDASGNVYVADSWNYRVQKFDSQGNFLAKWGSRGSGDGQFYRPYGIKVDVLGNVYVTDSDNHRVQKFDSQGNFLAKWGSRGSGDGQFNYLYGIALDGEGNVYVADSFNHRIQKFAPYQEPVSPSPYQSVLQGAWIVGDNNNIYRYEDGNWLWTSAKASHVTAVDGDTCWISQAENKNLYRYDQEIWQWTPAKSKYITTYGGNLLCSQESEFSAGEGLWLVEANSDSLFRYEDGNWIWTPAKAKSISAPTTDVLWLVQKDSGNLYKHTVSTNTWEWTAGKAKSISAVSENVVWVVGINNALYKYDHSIKKWTWYPVQALAVSAISESDVFLIDTSKRLCRFKNDTLEIIGGSCKELSAYTGFVFAEKTESCDSTSSLASETQKPADGGGCNVGTAGSGIIFLLLFLIKGRSFFARICGK